VLLFNASTEIPGRFWMKRYGSLTSPLVKRISGSKKFRSSPQKDFCNNIRQERTYPPGQLLTPKRTSAAPGGWSDRSRSKRDRGSLNQISQPTEFNALRKPPNALSRQGSVSLAAFGRSGMVVRLIPVVFGFDLGRAAVVTFFDLGSCRWRLIILGASEETIVVASDGEMRSSTRAGCAGVSLFA